MYCTESVPRGEEGSTGKYQYEVEGVPEGAARGNSRDRMLVFYCTPRLESRYRHYQIYKSDEALAIVIAIPLSRGSFFLSRTDNLKHILSLKLFIFGHYVTFQVIIEC